MAAHKDPGFFYYYDKSSSSGTYWLVVRGESAPMSEVNIAKLQRELSHEKGLSALRYGPSWRPAGNGRAYDFWLMIVDENGKENPPDADVERALQAIGGKPEPERQEVRPAQASEPSEYAEQRTMELGEQLRAMRRTLERAVEDVKETRRERDESRGQLATLQRSLQEREKQVQELEAEIGWTQSLGKKEQSVAKKELNEKEHTIRGFEYDNVRLREVEQELRETLEKFAKPAGTPMDAFRFAFANKLDASRLYFAQAATALFHRLANVMHIETHESGWMRQIRTRLLSERIIKEGSKEEHLIGQIHSLRTQVIHDDYHPSRTELKGLAKALDAFELFILKLEERGLVAVIAAAEALDDDEYSKRRKRDPSLRDKRGKNRGHF